MEPRRVVVTGTGVVSPVGNDKETAWRAIREGHSGIRRIQSFDTSAFDVKIAGEVLDLDPLRFATKREARRMDRFVLFAVAASEQAFAESRLLEDEQERGRVVNRATEVLGAHQGASARCARGVMDLLARRNDELGTMNDE